MGTSARFLTALSALALGALLGCGAAEEPTEVQDFRKLLEVLRGGVEGAVAKAEPIIKGDEAAIRDDYKSELDRHEDAERALNSILLQARELLDRGDPGRVAGTPAGRTVLLEFMGLYERAADAYENLRPLYQDFLESLDADSGGEAGLGRGPAAVAAAVTERVTQLANRSDTLLMRYLEDRARHSRWVRLSGEKVAGYEAALLGQAFMERHNLSDVDAFTRVADELDKLTALK